MITKRWAIFMLIGLLMLLTPLVSAEETQHGDVSASTAHSDESHTGTKLGEILPLWSVIPFAGILLSIAIFPLVLGEFWHLHYGKVSAAWAAIFAIPFAIAYRGEGIYEILHIYLIDYIPFIILLWGLFTVSGGILIRGTIRGKPIVNTVMLLIGTVIASWVGTTGASMVLIRPVLRANANRKSKVHIVVFFIFLVSNIGGSLTPLGDPPLFLGFLHGVPFFWTLNLIKPMAFVSILILVIFFVIDSLLYRRERVNQPETSPSDASDVREPLRIDGLFNLIFLVGIMGAVLMSGLVKLGQVNVFGVHIAIQSILRDIIIVAMGLLSLLFTPISGELRQANGFTWFPIVEVAKLFAGIFMTIVPALAILKAGTDGQLGFLIAAVKSPLHYFWVTGGLSSFLDNAPTYLTFLNTALGNFFPGVRELDAVHALIDKQEIYLLAISCGAVFMGANTYIGNAPNFMVRSIAEENDVKMPSFFGYMAWSCLILVPLFVLVTLIFFRF